jgi:hypothetical protein
MRDHHDELGRELADAWQEYETLRARIERLTERIAHEVTLERLVELAVPPLSDPQAN